MTAELEEMKNYLRLDSSDDVSLIYSLIDNAEKLCVNVARKEEHEMEEHSE